MSAAPGRAPAGSCIFRPARPLFLSWPGRGAESPGPAREHDEPLHPTVGTADPGEPAAGIAAVEVALHDVFDDRPEIPVLPLERALVFRDEPLETMIKHPVEDDAVRMTRAVDNRHIGNEESRNAPGTGKGKNPGTATGSGKKHALKNVENRQRSLTEFISSYYFARRFGT